MSHYINQSKLWLIGAGKMAIEYAKVLKYLDVSFDVIGRGRETAATFTEKTGIPVVIGGLENVLNVETALPSTAIITVNIEELANTAILLLKRGIKKILLEKPGGLTISDIQKVSDEAVYQNAEVYLAYNRRFYASTIKAKELIKEDGGPTSFQFEFTEWSHIWSKLNHPSCVKENAFFNNSTHVVDLAFYLGGKPEVMTCYVAGGLDWHPSASIFSGAGKTTDGALFSYNANWEAPGRWGIEVLTRKHKLILRPLEELYVQKIGSLVTEKVEVDNQLETAYKPGLYQQVSFFLNNKNLNNFAKIQTYYKEYINNVYKKIAYGS